MTADLHELATSWEVSLRADRKSDCTIDSYRTGVRLFLRWCDDNGHPAELKRDTVRLWMAELLDAGQSPSTARSRLSAVRRYSAWLAEENEIDTDELVNINPPKLTEVVVDRITDEQLAALLKACNGKAFIDLRDTAIIRLFLETGMRARELVRMERTDVNIAAGTAIVTGKGDKQRSVPFGPKCSQALDRYVRARKTHRLTSTTALWLGGGGQGFGYSGLDKALKQRAAAAGIEGFHIHQLRHTAAQRWLSAGGSEQGLMSVAGWSTRSMLDRYTKASAADRAAAESRNLNLGDI